MEAGRVVPSSNPTRVAGRRCVAFILDGFFFSLISGTILWFFDNDWYQTQGSETTLDPLQSSAYTMIILGLWAIEVLVLEGLYGWTLGKLVMQLRVVRHDGQPPGPLRAFLRYLLWIVDGFPYCLPIVGFALIVSTESHRRVGDLVAGTYVIDSVYAGRMIVHGPTGIVVGEKTVKLEDLGLSSADVKMAARLKSKDPVFDSNLDTYVVWNEKQQRYLMFDKASKTWGPIPES
jgi:uncharacterized RDD family membrane protein YckC